MGIGRQVFDDVRFATRSLLILSSWYEIGIAICAARMAHLEQVAEGCLLLSSGRQEIDYLRSSSVSASLLRMRMKPRRGTVAAFSERLDRARRNSFVSS